MFSRKFWSQFLASWSQTVLSSTSGKDSGGTSTGVRRDFYTSAFNALSSVEPSNVSEFVAILNRMIKSNTVPSISTVNALLRAFMLKQQYFQIFHLYKLLMERRSACLTPDAFTYSMVFKAINQTQILQGRNIRCIGHIILCP